MNCDKKGIIFLSGGGTELDSIEIDSKFAGSIPINAKILYIPHASKPKDNGYNNSLNWLSNTLNNIKKNNKYSIFVPENINDIKDKDLRCYDAIYIGGGNTFRLLSLLKSISIDKKIIKYYQNGGVIYGGSAGAIILGRSINTVSEERNNVRESSKGLNILNNLSIVCHFSLDDQEKIDNLKSMKNTDIICMPEDSAIMMNDNVITFYGGSKPTIINNC